MTTEIQALNRSPAPGMRSSQPGFVRGAIRVVRTTVTETSARPQMRARGVKRVVVLDDTEAIREFYRLALRIEFPGVEIREFADGDAAWRELARADPALFLTDINHPRMPCADMLAALASRRARFRIVVASGWLPAHRAKLASFTQSLDLVLLPKPLETSGFFAAIRPNPG